MPFPKLANKPLLCAALLLGLAGPATAQPVLPGAHVAIAPPGWDGTTPLAVTLFLHGARSGPDQATDDPLVIAAFAATGTLLVAPVGSNGAWVVPGAPTQGARDEIAFLDAVLDDVRARWPVDPARVRVAGFSAGAAMAATYACARGHRLQAVLTIAGTFWQPLPADCPGGGLPWMHIHGTEDPTWPMAGRTIRGRFTQGPPLAATAMLAREAACAPARPDAAIQDASCVAFAPCAAGSVLRLCLHPGQHDMEGAWFESFHAWADAVSSPPVSSLPDRR